MLLAACLLLACLLAKPGRSTLDTKKGYKTKTGSTSSVTLTLALTLALAGKSPHLDPPPPTLPEPPPIAPPRPPPSNAPPPPPPQGASGQQLVGGVVGIQNRGVAPPGPPPLVRQGHGPPGHAKRNAKRNCATVMRPVIGAPEALGGVVGQSGSGPHAVLSVCRPDKSALTYRWFVQSYRVYRPASPHPLAPAVEASPCSAPGCRLKDVWVRRREWDEKHIGRSVLRCRRRRGLGGGGGGSRVLTALLQDAVHGSCSHADRSRRYPLLGSFRAGRLAELSWSGAGCVPWSCAAHCPGLVRKVHPQVSTWIHFDGPLDPHWAWACTPTAMAPMLPLLSGEQLALPHTLRFVMETDSLADADPGLLSKAACVYLPPTLADPSVLVEAWLARTFHSDSPIASLRLSLGPVVSRLLPPVIDWVLARRHLPPKPNPRALTAECLRLLGLVLQSLMAQHPAFRALSDAHAVYSGGGMPAGQDPEEGTERGECLERSAVFAIVWACGGRLPVSERPHFDKFLRTEMRPGAAKPAPATFGDAVATSGPPSLRTPATSGPASLREPASVRYLACPESVRSPVRAAPGGRVTYNFRTALPPAAPGAETVFHYTLDPLTGDWAQWSPGAGGAPGHLPGSPRRPVPCGSPRGVPGALFPPSEGRVALSQAQAAQFACLFSAAKYPVLVLGPAGGGPGDVLGAVAASAAGHAHRVALARGCDAQWLRRALAACLARSQGDAAARPVTFLLDDVHVLAPNARGSGAAPWTPASEYLRQWLDTRDWPAKTPPHGSAAIADAALVAAAAVAGPGQAGQQLPPRLLRHCHVLHVPPMPEDEVKALLAQKLEGGPAPELMSVVDASVQFLRSVKALCPATPTAPHYAFGLRTLLQVFERLQRQVCVCDGACHRHTFSNMSKGNHRLSARQPAMSRLLIALPPPPDGLTTTPFRGTPAV